MEYTWKTKLQNRTSANWIPLSFLLEYEHWWFWQALLKAIRWEEITSIWSSDTFPTWAQQQLSNQLHHIISGESDPSLPQPAHLQCGFVAQIRQSLGKRTCIGKLEHSTIFSIILCYGSHGKYIGVLHHTSVTRVLYLYWWCQPKKIQWRVWGDAKWGAGLNQILKLISSVLQQFSPGPGKASPTVDQAGNFFLSQLPYSTRTGSYKVWFLATIRIVSPYSSAIGDSFNNRRPEHWPSAAWLTRDSILSHSIFPFSPLLMGSFLSRSIPRPLVSRYRNMSLWLLVWHLHLTIAGAAAAASRASEWWRLPPIWQAEE